MAATRLSWALALIPVIALLGGCETLGLGSTAPAGPQAMETRYLGSVAGDDPQAVQAARDLLDRGGSAADAIAAAGQVLAVTLPARAGLGGGGICLVHSPDGQNQELDFLPQTVPGSALPVPGMVRGLAVLQARYGRLPWSATTSRAEELANTGMAVSAMLISDLRKAGLSTEVNGAPLTPGTLLPQRGVSDVLASLRTGGPKDFYNGKLARALISAGIDGPALAAYTANWHAADGVGSGDTRVAFTSNDGGKASAAAWQALQGSSGSGDPSRAARDAAGVAAGTETSVTSAVVTDKTGLGVACGFTMGKLWGSGHLLGRLAIYGAAPVEPAVDRAISAAIVAKPEGGLEGVFSAGGGTAAAGDLAAVVWSTINGNRPPSDALAAQRGGEAQGGVAVPERVNAIVCSGMLPDNPQSCVPASDPRSGGYAVNADQVMR